MGPKECTEACWEMHGKAPLIFGEMGKNWAESRMICKCSPPRHGIREHQGRRNSVSKDTEARQKVVCRHYRILKMLFIHHCARGLYFFILTCFIYVHDICFLSVMSVCFLHAFKIV